MGYYIETTLLQVALPYYHKSSSWIQFTVVPRNSYMLTGSLTFTHTHLCTLAQTHTNMLTVPLAVTHTHIHNTHIHTH